MRSKNSSRSSHSSAKKGGRRDKRRGGNEATSPSALNLEVGEQGERGARSGRRAGFANEPREGGGGEWRREEDKHLGTGPYAEALSCPSKFGCP